MSSSNVPYSTTCPLCRTAIASALAIVLKRCAIIRTVFPEENLRILDWIKFSETESKLLVASSNINIWGFLINARARAILCLWPPLRVVPRWPMTVSSPSGSLEIISSTCASLSVCSKASLEMSLSEFSAYKIFSLIVPEKSVGSWLTIPISLRNHWGFNSFILIPSSSIMPELGS